MKKIYIPMEKVRDDSLVLAMRIFEARVKPTILYAVTRGGTYVANPISEYFTLINHPIKYGVVNAHSYKVIGKQEKVQIEGWIPKLESLTKKDKILLVDDIADKRKTLEALIADLEKKTPLRRDLDREIKERGIIIVTHDYKDYEGKPSNPNTEPDFYMDKWVVKKGKNIWLVYLSHEMAGLSIKEIKKHFPTFKELKNKKE